MRQRWSTAIVCLFLANICTLILWRIAVHAGDAWTGVWTMTMMQLATAAFVAVFCSISLLSGIIGRHGRLRTEAERAEIYKQLYCFLLRHASDPVSDGELAESVVHDPAGILEDYERGFGATEDPLEYGWKLVEQMPGLEDYLARQPDGGSIIARLKEGERRYEMAWLLMHPEADPVEAGDVSRNGTGTSGADEVKHAAEPVKGSA